MPRMYVTPLDFVTDPLGSALLPQQGQVSATDGAFVPNGVVERLLWRASARVDKYCKRRLGAPGTTTLGANLSPGATAIPLTSCIGFDGTPDTVITLGTGSASETLRCEGLVAVTPRDPFPATVNLLSGTATQFAHNQGEPIAESYYEQRRLVGGETTSVDMYYDFTQQGQIAQMHAPQQAGENVRKVFLSGYPILSITDVSVVYPWANVADHIGSTSDLSVMNAEGWYQFPIGYFVPPGSFVQTTYRGGWSYLPDDVQQAVIWEAASILALSYNPYGVHSDKSGVRETVYAQLNPRRKSTLLFSQEAEVLLEDYINVALG